MKILVIGCGSIGRRHIRLLKEMGVRVEGVDTSREAGWRVSDEFGVMTYTELHHALEHCYDEQGELSRWDGAIIATPNHLHYETAQEVIVNAGIPVLIEKPLAHTLVDAEALTNHADTEGVPMLIGYTLRFHPGLRKLKKLLDEGTLGTVRHATIRCSSYLPSWRPGTDYHQNYAASQAQGGGVLLDCSHEIDYACWLLGEPESVSCTTLNTGALGIETEELADLVIRFKSGVQANLHLSYLDTWASRGCRIVGDRATAVWDVGTDFVWLQPCTAQTNPVAPDDLYRAELAHFLKVVRGEEQPAVTGQDGVIVLRLVEAAKRSALEGRVVNV